MPSITIGAAELDREDIVVALPSLKEHGPVRRLGIFVQECLMEHGFAAHCVEDTLVR
ncbi:hypothetical protein GR328_17030 [Microvirga makkahensis]|uniref:Uncharacterized protein n=1 Tax=Microvirga makkahensis TaxID=1128670 RepID=A0A7X3MTU0_9HYPH|nr:hypothetical protein [Microvirga makkahensis]